MTDTVSGVTALVLNRPEKRVADAGGPSRGLLPLLAVEHGRGWPEQLDLTGMASFRLVLVGPAALLLWDFDGVVLGRTDLEVGTHLVTSGGAEDGKSDRYLRDFARRPGAWRQLVQSQEPQDDPAALVVRHEDGDRVFATVFGQLMTTTPGHLALSYSRIPWASQAWTERSFG